MPHSHAGFTGGGIVSTWRHPEALRRNRMALREVRAGMFAAWLSAPALVGHARRPSAKS